MPYLLRFLAARWRVVLLVCVTTVIWMAHYDRWTAASWSYPTDYRGDSLEILARIQAAAEGDTVPLRPQMLSRLGAPFGANWSAYPSSDLMLLWAFGVIARVIGVFQSANLALLLASVSSAVAFYGCARWLRARWEWAFAGALLFAFTFQTFHRGLAHLLIVYSWTVPLALLSCALIARSKRIRLLSGAGVFCLLTAAAIGAGNPYVWFLYLQLVGWALVSQWVGDRRRENLVTGLVALGVSVLAFLIVESHVWLFAPDTAAAAPVVRNYGGTERYALKPIELLLPPAGHRWDALAFFGQRYVRWSDWRTGEAFAPYLGLVGIAGLAWLVGVSLLALLRGRRLPGMALAAGWVLAFSSVGGITNVLAFFTGVNVFRATNRFSVFLSAIVILFLILRMARWTGCQRRWVSVTAALGITAVGLADQLPRAMDAARRERIEQRVTSDLDLGVRVQKVLPKGAMVFQLPVVGFPEVVPPYQLSDYEYFRPYLGSPSLRFTYGSLKGRSRGGWQRDVAELPPTRMVQQLEKYGFAAVYLNRRGFEDRAEGLLEGLEAAGRKRRIVSRSGEQVVVLLNPAAVPVIPMARRLTFGRGWHEARAGEPHWAFGPAALSYYNPHPVAVKATVRLVLSGVAQRHLRIHLNDGIPFTTEIDERQAAVELPVELQPGINRFDIASNEPAMRMSRERDALRSFAVHETDVRVEFTWARSVVAAPQ